MLNIFVETMMYFNSFKSKVNSLQQSEIISVMFFSEYKLLNYFHVNRVMFSMNPKSRLLTGNANKSTIWLKTKS